MLPATQVVFRSVLCDSCAIERKASLIALWRAIMQHENWIVPVAASSLSDLTNSDEN